MASVFLALEMIKIHVFFVMQTTVLAMLATYSENIV